MHEKDTAAKNRGSQPSRPRRQGRSVTKKQEIIQNAVVVGLIIFIVVIAYLIT